MKIDNFLIVSICIAILWTFVKTVSIRKSLAKHAVKDYTSTDMTKILNNEAESSVNPQKQKYEETLKPKLKITKETDKGGDKVNDKSEYMKKYMKIYRQNNKERLNENNRNYYEQNKDKVLERQRKYREHNKEKINETKKNYYKRNRSERIQCRKSYYQKNRETELKKQKIYQQNNKEKRNEYKRKWRLKKKNIQSDNNEGTSSVNPQTGDSVNKGKLPIVCEEEENHFNQAEEECNNSEDKQNQIEIEEPNKIIGDYPNNKDLNKKIYSFDLNEKPEDEE